MILTLFEIILLVTDYIILCDVTNNNVYIIYCFDTIRTVFIIIVIIVVAVAIVLFLLLLLFIAPLC